MNEVLDVRTNLIKIGDRFRKDMGDLDGEDLLLAIQDPNWSVAGLDVVARTRIAKKIELAFIARVQQASIKKTAWINSARVIFQSGDRQACHVCGQFKGVTQAHHVAPLGIQYDMGVKRAIQDFVWLCPTHHAIAHAVISEHVKGEHSPFIEGVPSEDLNVIEKISKAGIDKLVQSLITGKRDANNGL